MFTHEFLQQYPLTEAERNQLAALHTDFVPLALARALAALVACGEEAESVDVRMIELQEMQ